MKLTAVPPFGVLAEVPIADPVPPEAIASLLPEERALLAPLRGARISSFVHGRLALRTALDAAGAPPSPILSTPRGAPQVPAGFVGSLSHKRDRAIAIAARDEGWHLGVDLEDLGPERLRIADRVLTRREQALLAAMPEADRWRALLVRFSIKEAVYKALDPYVLRYVAFDEADVDLEPPRVRLTLAKGEGPFEVEAALAVASDVRAFVRVRRPAP